MGSEPIRRTVVEDAGAARKQYIFRLFHPDPVSIVPDITCPACGYEFYLDEEDYDDEIQCPNCGTLLHVTIERGEVKDIIPLEEGIEEEEWLEDEDFWEEEEEEEEEFYWEEEEEI